MNEMRQEVAQMQTKLDQRKSALEAKKAYLATQRKLVSSL